MKDNIHNSFLERIDEIQELKWINSMPKTVIYHDDMDQASKSDQIVH